MLKARLKPALQAELKTAIPPTNHKKVLADYATQRVLRWLLKGGLEEIAKVLGFTKLGVEKAARRLRLAQRLRKVGGKRFGHWEVVE